MPTSMLEAAETKYCHDLLEDPNSGDASSVILVPVKTNRKDAYPKILVSRFYDTWVRLKFRPVVFNSQCSDRIFLCNERYLAVWKLIRSKMMSKKYSMHSNMCRSWTFRTTKSQI